MIKIDIRATLISVALLSLIIAFLFLSGIIEVKDKNKTEINKADSDNISNEVATRDSIKIGGNTDIHIREEDKKGEFELTVDVTKTESKYIDSKDSTYISKIVKSNDKTNGFSYNENKKFILDTKDTDWIKLKNTEDESNTILLSEDKYNDNTSKSLEEMVTGDGLSYYEMQTESLNLEMPSGVTILGRDADYTVKTKEIKFNGNYVEFKKADVSYLFASVKPSKSKTIIMIKISSKSSDKLEDELKECLKTLLLICR